MGMNLSVSYDIELDVGDPADLSVFPEHFCCTVQLSSARLDLTLLLFPARGIELLTKHQRYLRRELYHQ